MFICYPYARPDDNIESYVAGNGLKLQWKLLDEHTLYDAITTIIDQPRLDSASHRYRCPPRHLLGGE